MKLTTSSLLSFPLLLAAASCWAGVASAADSKAVPTAATIAQRLQQRTPSLLRPTGASWLHQGRANRQLQDNEDKDIGSGSDMGTDDTSNVTTCDESPFLWLIQKEVASDDAATATTMTTVGFAVGTFHLPRDLVISNESWRSLVDAADDACAIYGELDVTNTSVLMEINAACSGAPMEEDSPATLVTLEQANATLGQMYRDALQTLADEYGPPAGISGNALVANLEELSLVTILEIIQAYNTPSYKDIFFEMLLNPATDEIPDFLDADIMALGRPSGGLETVETQCDVLTMLEAQLPMEDTFVQEYEASETLGPDLEKGLTESGTDMLEAYRCGNTERLSEVVTQATMGAEADLMEALLDDRNVQMTQRIVEILDSTATLPMFAVGVAHWLQGEQNMKLLLELEGYTLLKIDSDHYDSELYPEVSADTCSYPLESSGARGWSLELLLAAATLATLVAVLN